MIAYVDSSALLRRILRQPGAFAGWRQLEKMVSSRLLEMESLRTLDRYRIRREISAAALSAARRELEETFDEFDLVEVGRPILQRASEPLPLSLGTLDAIHLATALLWREDTREALAIVTHDGELAAAGRLYGFPVLGA